MILLMKNYLLNLLLPTRLLTVLLLGISLVFTQGAKAQVLYKSIAAAQIEMPTTHNGNESINLNSEGNFTVKDGVLEDIHSFKFVMINAQLKALLAAQLATTDSISFEQSHVMVLPMMGMVHFIGKLTIGEVSNRADFQLRFAVNKDDSITFKGTKSIKLSDYSKAQKEIMLDIDFVLANKEHNLLK